jgi:hypothetical protein
LMCRLLYLHLVFSFMRNEVVFLHAHSMLKQWLGLRVLALVLRAIVNLTAALKLH